MSTSGVVAREVLAADAANLLPYNFRAGQGRRVKCPSTLSHRLRRPSRPRVPETAGTAPAGRTGSCRSLDAGGDEVKSAWERAEEKRQAKLELVREQVENGSLRIRKMTKEERRLYPRRPVSPKRPGRR